MPDQFNAQLASHDAILRHLVALIVKMDTVLATAMENQDILIDLLQRQLGGEIGDGHA